jgi:hypothetical protein
MSRVASALQLKIVTPNVSARTEDASAESPAALLPTEYSLFSHFSMNIDRNIIINIP